MLILNTSNDCIIMTPQEIKDLRKKIGDTQKEFAQKLGFTDYNTVSRWERGVRKPHSSALILLKQLKNELENK